MSKDLVNAGLSNNGENWLDRARDENIAARLSRIRSLKGWPRP